MVVAGKQHQSATTATHLHWKERPHHGAPAWQMTHPHRCVHLGCPAYPTFSVRPCKRAPALGFQRQPPRQLCAMTLELRMVAAIRMGRAEPECWQWSAQTRTSGQQRPDSRGPEEETFQGAGQPPR